MYISEDISKDIGILQKYKNIKLVTLIFGAKTAQLLIIFVLKPRKVVCPCPTASP